MNSVGSVCGLDKRKSRPRRLRQSESTTARRSTTRANSFQATWIEPAWRFRLSEFGSGHSYHPMRPAFGLHFPKELFDRRRVWSRPPKLSSQRRRWSPLQQSKRLRLRPEDVLLPVETRRASRSPKQNGRHVSETFLC